MSVRRPAPAVPESLADLPAPAVEGCRPARLVDDPGEPGSEAIRRGQLGQVPPGPDEDLLGHLARVGLVAEERGRRPVGRRQAGVDERGERLLVAVAGTLDESRVTGQVRVRRRRPLHRRRCYDTTVLR